MAHTFDTSALLAENSTSNPVSVNYTCGAGTTLLIVALAVDGRVNNRSGTLTYNSVNMTQIGSRVLNATGEMNIEMWYLLNPTTGSAVPVSIPNASGYTITAYAYSFKAGTGYTTTLDTNTSATGTSTNPSSSVDTAGTGKLVVAMVGDDVNAWNPTDRTGTQIADKDHGAWGTGHQYILNSASDPQTTAWTFGTSADWAMIIASFNTVAGNPNASTVSTSTPTDVPIITLVEDRNVLVPEAGWYNTSWNYRVKVTVQNNKVDADLTDFPIYINLTNLPAGFHANVNQTDGRDIRVTTSNGTSEVPREVVYYDAATDTGEIHFKGDLSNASDTVFYVYYGNAAASDYEVTDTYGRNNVWDGNYGGVYHMVEASGNLVDSTANGKTQTASGTPTYSQDGQVGKSIYFSGDDDFYSTASPPVIFGSIPTQVTVSAWVKVDNYSALAVIALHGDNGNYYLGINTSGTLHWNVLQETTGWKTHSNTGYSTATWYYVTGTWLKNSYIRLYVNGAAISSPVSAGGDYALQDPGTNYPVDIGGFRDPSSSLRLPGYIDEVRFSNLERSSTWISTEFNNQNSPTDFYVVGNHESRSDQIIISDVVTVSLSAGVSDNNINVISTSILTDSITSIGGSGLATASDTATISDNINAVGGSAVSNTTETSSVGENVIVRINNPAAVFDVCTANESITITAGAAQGMVADTSTLSDQISAIAGPAVIQIADTCTPNDSITINSLGNNNITVSDTCTVTDSISAYRIVGTILSTSLESADWETEGFVSGTNPLTFSSNSHFGLYSAKMTGGINTENATYSFTEGQYEVYAGVYVYFETLGASTQNFFELENVATGDGLIVRKKADDTLVLIHTATGQVGSSSSVLETGKWYYLELHFKRIADGSDVGEVRLNGVTFASSSSLTYDPGTTYIDKLWLGTAGFIYDNSIIYFDDVGISDRDWVVGYPAVKCSDTSTVSEAIATIGGPGSAEITDTSTLSEAILASASAGIASISDICTAADIPTINLSGDNYIPTTETCSVGELITIAATSGQAIVADIVTAVDIPTPTTSDDNFITVSDTMTLADSINIVGGNGLIQTVDTCTASESINAISNLNISINETCTAGEVIIAQAGSGMAVIADTITATDIVLASTSGDNFISIADICTINEAIISTATAGIIEISDTCTLADEITVQRIDVAGEPINIQLFGSGTGVRII